MSTSNAYTARRSPHWLVRNRGTVAVLLLVCIASWGHQQYYDFQHDDAYISYRYARNWVDGHGPVFNAGERVEGYSNFLHVVALATLHSLGIPLATASRTLGTMSAWLLIVATFAVARCLFTRSAGIALLPAAVVALHAGVAVWARSGLETLPFSVLLTVAQLIFLLELRHARGHWVSGLAYGLCALVRADGFVFVAPAILFSIVSHRARYIPSLIVPFAVVTTPHLVWRIQYYGALLPNSYYAKVGWSFWQPVRGIFYSYQYVRAFGGLLLFVLPLLLILFRDRARDRARLFLGLSLAVGMIYIVGVGGDHMPMSRFFVPLVPALTILTVEALIELSARLRQSGQRGTAVGALIGLTLLVSGVLPSLNRRRLPYTAAVANKLFVEQWRMAGEWFRDNLAADASIAAQPVGAIGFFSKRPLIDMYGINDPHIARVAVDDMGRGTPGHQKSDFAYVASRRPTVVFRGVRDTPRDGQAPPVLGDEQYAPKDVSLGQGRRSDAFGVVETVELYLWYDELRGPP